MSIKAADVKKLRDQTGAGMMDCKKALTAAEGDFDKAIEELRKKGQKLSAKRADREANEGAVIAKISSNKNNGVVVRLSSETDFVSKGDSFIALANQFADIALSNLPADKEALLALDSGDGMTIAQRIEEQTGVIGEKIELTDYAKIETKAGEGQVLPYIHMGNRAGVIVAVNLEGPQYEEPAKNVAMQVAAMKPIALDKDGIDASVIEKEIEIEKEVLRKEGKPEAMLDKIVLGKMAKFFKENTLLNQVYVKAEEKETVAKYLKNIHADLTVTDFKHIKLG